MPQKETWDNEYKNPQLISKEDKPQNDVLRFFKFLKKECQINLTGLSVLDLGSGTGRNSNYLAELGNDVVGLEISPTAIKFAKEKVKEKNIKVEYKQHDIGTKYPFKDEVFDLVIDVISSNSLNNKERDVYLEQTCRVLKQNGYFFVKALCKDGDKNAKALLKKNNGPELDTYLIEELNLIERVFTKEDFVSLYSKYFEIIQLAKKTNYARFKGQNYKRNYWVAYLKKGKTFLNIG